MIVDLSKIVGIPCPRRGGRAKKSAMLATTESEDKEVNQKGLMMKTARNELLSPSYESGVSGSSCTTSEERKECDSSEAKGGELNDVDWEAMATKLWDEDETEELWSWLWDSSSPGFEIQSANCGQEETDLEGWFL